MAVKRLPYDEEARWPIQSGVDKLSNAVKVTLGTKGRNVALDKKFGACTLAKDDGSVRKMAPPARHYWPSVNSQRAPRRPQWCRSEQIF